MTNIKMGLTIEEAAEMSGIGRNTMRKLVDWEEYARDGKRRVTIKCAELFNDAGVVGAAWLGNQAQ